MDSASTWLKYSRSHEATNCHSGGAGSGPGAAGSFSPRCEAPGSSRSVPHISQNRAPASARSPQAGQMREAGSGSVVVTVSSA